MMRALATHQPVPVDNGYWLIWNPDTGEYSESDFPLSESGGTAVNVSFELDPSNGMLYQVTADSVEVINNG